jgi:eukaryotic-like serine/threonine-protein kinase
MSLETVGRYQIIAELGRGGMATVYKAYDPHFKREVAVKVLPGQLTHDPLFRTRFEREAQTIAALEHPAIVPVYDFGEEEERPYLVMRYMAGGSLSERLQQGPLSTQQTIEILRKLAPALDHAHQNGIIHRDLKPGNILFDAQGNPYLADFGIAKLIEGSQTLTGSAIIGTPAYISPEQAKGGQEIDGRSDIYSLGVILYEMLTGQTPYQADTPIQVIMQHILEPVPILLTANADLPDYMQTVIDRAMAKETGHRFATAGEMVLAVSQLNEGESTPGAAVAVPLSTTPASPLSMTTLPPPPATPPVTDATVVETAPLRQAAGRPLWLWAVALVVLIMLLAGGFWIWGMDNGAAGAEPTEPAMVAAEETVIVVVTMAGTATETVSTATTTPTLAPSLTPAATATLTTGPTLEVTTDQSHQLEVTLASVNLRQGPGTMYATAGFLRQGDRVEIIARSRGGDWYLVRLPTDRVAWLAGSVTQPVVPFDNDDIPIAVTIPPVPTATPTNTPLPTATFTPTPLPTRTPTPVLPTNTPTPTSPIPTATATVDDYP